MTTRAPVALIIFNRPDTTARVWERIESARPSRLFVIADGPRAGRAEEDPCRAARGVTERVTWPAKITRLYSDENLGCARRVASGLDAVFDEVERAIILEDDCVPDPSFFPYAEELLERFAHDERIMAISGNSFQPGVAGNGFSYYFSRYNHVWGWASWRRAWRHFDFEMRGWPAFRDRGMLADVLEDEAAVGYWTRELDATFADAIDSWAYRWTFACWAQSGLTALPSVNLVENIGFDDRATHTGTARPGFPPPSRALELPLRHPPFVVRDARADAYTEQVNFSGRVRRSTALKRALVFVRSRLGGVRRRVLRRG